MFNTIVVGLKGSEEPHQALSYAIELARRDNARIVIAHVEDRIGGRAGDLAKLQEICLDPIHDAEDEIRVEALCRELPAVPRTASRRSQTKSART
jgi:nucleotide-binding universal stress UspA family protein